MAQFGTWETYYYDVDGILMEAAREDGFCVSPEEEEFECITSGGFWQYGYWWENEWMSTSGRCQVPPEFTYVASREGDRYSHSYDLGGPWDPYSHLSRALYFGYMATMRDWDIPRILGDFWRGKLLDSSYSFDFAVYLLDQTTCEQFESFFTEKNMFLLGDVDRAWEFDYNLKRKKFPYYLRKAFFEVYQDC